MKPKIHPPYTKAVITCSCGETFETGSVKAVMRVDVCSKCHPYFTGEQRIVDTAGRVERFKRRFGITD
ncbi:MAG: 50S ribosomal protein L31 [Chloroflexota bacterium]|nr:50S ribosomal protein L31 [Dehalococcoidia bacterium]MDW8253869.1 50S ribosomal protein L31 [Chloroflexota bacterium]